MKFDLLFMLIAASLPMITSAQTKIQAPVGGWRLGAGSDPYTQEVHYPASSVNAPKGISNASLIKGHITGLAKAGSPLVPATLIVNGVSMPLRIEEDGSFQRPYAFGRGSNSVEIRPPGSSKRARTQFYDVAANKKQARMRVCLTWDSDATDLDLHIVTPQGRHSWYGNRVITGGGALDVDVTTGYGPEIFAHPAPENGIYHVYVNYYGSGDDTGALTVAQIAIITNENTPNEKQQIFRVPMRRAGELMLVNSFVYP